MIEFDLPQMGEVVIGRSSGADVRIEHSSVSRRHALLSIAGDADIRVRDLESTNGTYIGSSRLIGERSLESLDEVIRVGDVLVQVRRVRASRMIVPKFLSGDEFDRRLDEEAERCLRYGRSLSVVALNVKFSGSNMSANHAVTRNLRTLDSACRRSSGRVDVVVVEAGTREGRLVAERIVEDLMARGDRACASVAAFPDDAPSPSSLMISLQLALRSAQPGEVKSVQAGARVWRFGTRAVVIADPEMARLYARVERVAGSSLPVLVHGETGSGKEAVADAIHTLSARSRGPLVKLNCAAMSEHLLESELFGHMRGAFTGAATDKPGLFEAADGGTLFLDEVAEMSPALQSKLLRVVEQRTIRRLGATTETPVDCRLVAATHRDLREQVEAGAFREDLYYRLGAVVLEIPPLRRRQAEIPLLVEQFVVESCDDAGREPVAVSQGALSMLQHYAWPGNIRELRNAIGAAVMMCDGRELLVEHLPSQLTDAAHSASLPQEPSEPPLRPLEDEVRALERRMIVRALDECSGNQTKAAELLGMPRRTFVSKLDALGIARPRKRKH